jgi:hypothetical protein
MMVKLFNSIYDTNGTDPVPEEELQAKFKEDYARIRVISMPLTGSDGNVITDPAELDQMKAKAQGYKDRLANGEVFSSVYDEYYAESTGQTVTETSDGSSDGSIDSDGSGDEVDEDYEQLNDVMLDVNGTTPSAEMAAAVKAAPLDTPTLFEDTDAYYVFVRLDISVRTDWYLNYRETVMHALRDDAFDALCAEKAKTLTVVRNEQAIATYDSSKLSIIL